MHFKTELKRIHSFQRREVPTTSMKKKLTQKGGILFFNLTISELFLQRGWNSENNHCNIFHPDFLNINISPYFYSPSIYTVIYNTYIRQMMNIFS